MITLSCKIRFLYVLLAACVGGMLYLLYTFVNSPEGKNASFLFVPSLGFILLPGTVPTPTDLIMSISVGYPASSIERFIRSIRRFDKTSHVMLFLDSDQMNNPSIGRYCQEYKIEYIHMSYDSYSFTEWSHVLQNASRDSSFFTKTNIAGHRFGYQYAWLLKQNPSKFRYIFIVYFRDTIFQGNIFNQVHSSLEEWINPSSILTPSGLERNLQSIHWSTTQTQASLETTARSLLHPTSSILDPMLIVFTEATRMELQMCLFNRVWLGHVYGYEWVEYWKHRYIISAGAILGTYSGMINWIQPLVHQIEKFSQTGKYDSNDQGIHNYLIHGDHINASVFMAHNERNQMVFTMAQLMREEIKTDKEGYVQVTERLDTYPAVLHQYDRFEDIMKLYNG